MPKTLSYLVTVTIPDDHTEQTKTKVDNALVEQLKDSVDGIIYTAIDIDAEDIEVEVKPLPAPF